MSQSAAVRRVEGAELPAPGTWTIDAAHSGVSAVARHLMFAKVRGHFREVAGAVQIGETPEQSFVEATIQAASIDTANEMRDNHLRSADFLDVENHPTLTYRSTAVTQIGPTALAVDGLLTIRGITLPVPLQVSYEGLVRNPWGKDVAIFSATGEIDREAFGITWNQALETGGVLVGRTLKVELEIQAVRAE